MELGPSLFAETEKYDWGTQSRVETLIEKFRKGKGHVAETWVPQRLPDLEVPLLSSVIT